MLPRSGVPGTESIKGVVRGQFFVGGLDAVLDDILEVFVLAQADTGPHHLAHALPVKGVVQVPVVQGIPGTAVQPLLLV